MIARGRSESHLWFPHFSRFHSSQTVSSELKTPAPDCPSSDNSSKPVESNSESQKPAEVLTKNTAAATKPTEQSTSSLSANDKDKTPEHSKVPSTLHTKLRDTALPLLRSDFMEPRNRFALHKRLGRSLYGEMFYATDRLTGKKLAIKVSVRALMEKKVSRSGVVVLEDPTHEAKILKMLGSHPNVVKLFCADFDLELHWLAQEYVDGCELFDYVHKNGPLPEQTARQIFIGIVNGLHHIHTHKICHLDLSLENVMVDKSSNFRVKICDFGLARVMTPGTLFKGIANGSCKPGKINYMAPEILVGESFDGTKADVFSLGVVLFGMLTGQSPFESASMMDLRYMSIARNKLRCLLQALGDPVSDRVSAPACDLLEGLLALKPASRLTLHQIAAHPWIKQH